MHRGGFSLDSRFRIQAQASVGGICGFSGRRAADLNVGGPRYARFKEVGWDMSLCGLSSWGLPRHGPHSEKPFTTETLRSRWRIPLPELVELTLPQFVDLRFLSASVLRDLCASWGQTESGRYLLVIFRYLGHNRAWPITARDMDGNEKRFFRKK